MIPRDQRHMYRYACEHCALCKWCYTRSMVKDMFAMKDGPLLATT